MRVLRSLKDHLSRNSWFLVGLLAASAAGQIARAAGVPTEKLSVPAGIAIIIAGVWMLFGLRKNLRWDRMSLALFGPLVIMTFSLMLIGVWMLTDITVLWWAGWSLTVLGAITATAGLMWLRRTRRPGVRADGPFPQT